MPAMCLLGVMLARRLWERMPAGRLMLAVTGGAVVVSSVAGANRLAGKWYNADTFAAGYAMFAERGVEIGEGEVVLTSQLTFNRFAGLEMAFGLPSFEVVRSRPTTPQQWIERYPGRLILVSDHDRRPPAKAKQAGNTLFGESVASLAGFERLARQEAPAGRLQALAARVAGGPPETNPVAAVELYRIPDGTPRSSKD
jgi:hypothetical protein